MGVGDRFGHQGVAQLEAFIKAREQGIDVVPVWNKSFREHSIIGTSPDDTRAAADAAVSSVNWTDSYYVDADHINNDNVDGFIIASNFFTLDVADFTGKPAEESEITKFVEKHSRFTEPFAIEGIEGGTLCEQRGDCGDSLEVSLCSQAGGGDISQGGSCQGGGELCDRGLYG